METCEIEVADRNGNFITMSFSSREDMDRFLSTNTIKATDGIYELI